MDDLRPECGECHHKYDKGERCPRSLFCGHTFCTACLERLISGNTKRCPSCKRPFIALKAVQLPTDFTILKGIPSSAPSTTSLRISDHFSHGISDAATSHRTTFSSGLDLKSSTDTKSSLLPNRLTNATNYSSPDSRTTSDSTSSKSYSSGSRSKLRNSEDPKDASSFVDKKNKDDVDSPRSTTFLRYNREDLRESRPNSSISYEFPTISSRISTGNRDSRTSQSSVASDSFTAQRANDLTTTSESPNNGTTEAVPDARHSRTFHGLYTSRDERLAKTTPALGSESKLTQTRSTSSVQLPLSSGVSRLFSQEQTPSDSGSTQLNPRGSRSSFQSPTLTDPHVSTSTLTSFPRLSKHDTTPLSSVLHVSSNTKKQMDVVDKRISSQERDEAGSLWRSRGNDAVESKTKVSNTPSHVLKMCRSIVTKSRNVSDNEIESSVVSTAPSLSENDAKNSKKYHLRDWRQDSNESKDDNPASLHGSSTSPEYSRSIRTRPTSSTLNRNESNEPIGERREAVTDNETKDPEVSLEPLGNYNASLTRRENAATQSGTSVPPTSPNETSHQDEVKETSNEKWKTESFDEEKSDNTDNHHIGRMIWITEKPSKFDGTLSASLKDLSVSKTETSASALNSNRTLTRSLSSGREKYNESESGTPSRESKRLARSSALSARLSARTSFISRSIQEENEEIPKENLSAEKMKFHERENEFNKSDTDPKPTNRSSSLSARLKSRTSFLSRASSADEDLRERHRQGQHGSPDGILYSPDPSGRRSSSWDKMRETKTEDYTTTSSWSDSSFHSLTPLEDKMESHRNSESNNYSPRCADVAPNSSQTKPSLPSSPPPTFTSSGSNSICHDPLRGGGTIDQEDEAVSGYQAENSEDESTATDGVSLSSEQMIKLSAEKISGSHDQVSPAKYTTVEPRSVYHQEKWMRYNSADSPGENEVANATTSYRSSSHEGSISQEFPSSSPFTASSWKSRSASSHPNYHSPLVGKSQRITSRESSSLGHYPDDSSQARIKEIDSGMKSKSLLSINNRNNNDNTITSSEGRSGINREERSHQVPLSGIDESLSSKTWQGRFGHSMQDSKKDLEDSSINALSLNSSTKRPTGSLPQATKDFNTGYSGADTDRHEQRFARSRNSATQESSERGRLSDPGREKRIMYHSRACDTNKRPELDVEIVSSAHSEDDNKETDTEKSEHTSHSWRMPGIHREEKGHTYTSNTPRRESQGAALNNTLYGRPQTSEGDNVGTELANTVKDSASDEQSKDSKSTRDGGADIADVSHLKVIRDNSRLMSSYDSGAPQTNTTPVGKDQDKKLSRPVSTNSVQDIWRARNAKNRHFVKARVRQTRSPANEAPEETETSEADVQLRRGRYQWPDSLHADPESGDAKPKSLCPRMSFLRSNLQGMTEVGAKSTESASTFASQHERITQSGRKQGDGDGSLNVPSGKSAPSQGASHSHSTPAGTTDAERTDVKPPKQRGSGDQDNKYTDTKTTESEEERQLDSLGSVQTETEALTRDDVTETDDHSQRYSFPRYPEPVTDSVDAPHLWKTTSKSNHSRLQTKATPLDVGVDVLQTGTEKLPDFQRKLLLSPDVPPGVGSCETHGFLLHLFCKKCEAWVCDDCLHVLHQPPPEGHCEVISAEEAVVHMKMAHSEFLTSKVNALDHFRDELSKLLAECDFSTREHEANVNQLNLKLQEEERFLKGIESMRCLALQKMNQIDYWEDLLHQNATRLNQSSSTKEIFSAVHINRRNILSNIMGGLDLPEPLLEES